LVLQALEMLRYLKLHHVVDADRVPVVEGLEQGRGEAVSKLRFAAGLDFLDVLIGELQHSSAKINLATEHVAYEAWCEGSHDDLVLAVALHG